MGSILDSPEMQRLVRQVEEAARSTREGVKYFVEPAQGTLSRAVSRRHHLIFGRRGSGKSSLLRKAEEELTGDRRPISYVDLEAFKGHAYPDVLLSILISTFDGFHRWLEGPAVNPRHKSSFWKRLVGRIPTKAAYSKKECGGLAIRVKGLLGDLRQQLFAADDAQIETKSADEQCAATGAEGNMNCQLAGLGASVKAELKADHKSLAEEKEAFRRSKIDFLHRHIIDYQRVFREMAQLSSGDAYLFLDDLYHIRRADQANVVDYFHRIAKPGGLWLKVGTVRHRSTWYVHGDPPRGLKLGDDADEINLDLTLEKYPIARQFLQTILSQFAREMGLQALDSFITENAIDRLVLASGGVARDFLTIFRLSVDQARQRAGGRGRGEKIGVEDVNVAAGEHDNAKRQEFNDEAGDDRGTLDLTFDNVRDFCLEQAKSNCFLLAKDLSGREVDGIHELVDLKLLHLVRGRVTVSGRPGKIFEAYMLDVSQYAGTRKRRGLREIQFWRDEEQLRRASMIYQPSQQP